MGCACGSVSQKQLDSIKNAMSTRNEKVIVDWSKCEYIGGLYGDDSVEGLICLTNLNLHFLSPAKKFEQPIKKVDEVISSDNYGKKKGDFTVFKLESGKEIVMRFIDQKDKLKEDCKSLVSEKKGSKVLDIEVL